MNHKEINNDLYTNIDENEIRVREGGAKIEQQCDRREK